jgi:hypothetical protein
MAADLKYIELCARQIAAVAKNDKIVVENRLYRSHCGSFKKYP